MKDKQAQDKAAVQKHTRKLKAELKNNVKKIDNELHKDLNGDLKLLALLWLRRQLLYAKLGKMPKFSKASIAGLPGHLRNELSVCLKKHLNMDLEKLYTASAAETKLFQDKCIIPNV